MKELEECFRKGELKKIPENKAFASDDLKQAEFFLNEAYDLIEIKKKEMALIALYNSVFHAARALLYLDEIKEKSHYCLQKYLETHYVSSKMLSREDISMFDLLRGLRQEVQYNVIKTEFPKKLIIYTIKLKDSLKKSR
ncbi:MAG: HEPN domain-containing protein [Candidatus Diapherotrites archaeon]